MILKKINDVAQISKMKNAFVAPTQRIKDVLLSRFDDENKVSNRKSFLESRSNFKKNFYNRKSERTSSTTEIRNVSTSNARRENTTKFSLRNFDKVSLSARNKRICYNCDEKKHDDISHKSNNSNSDENHDKI